ncbi:MAG: hypothetical protein OXC98_03285 [bacterium]|nr:hypothetical protein [Acidimicrobiia bacterium]MCY4649374.1 hypothetical protein [bacterium]
MRLVQSTVCRVSRPLVRLGAVDQKDGNSLVARHAGHCLRCQAERAIEHRIHRTLAAMEGNVIKAPAGLVPGVISSLDASVDYPELEFAKAGERVAIAAAVVGVVSVVAWTLTRRVRSTA